jgi:hypothetical protein
MAQRFCPKCNADVEDAGGFCLLGHSLRLDTAMPSITELRAEVDRAFDDARAEVAQMLASAPVPPAPIEGQVAPPTAVPASVPAVPGPPPPNQVHQPEQSNPHHAVWEALSEESSLPLAHEDPIAAFAPAPRMDWGPERSRRPFRKDN